LTPKPWLLRAFSRRTKDKAACALAEAPTGERAAADQAIDTRAGHTLHHQQGTFYVWSGTLPEADRDEIRASVYEFWTARGNRMVTN
jgi:hypothetical protein